MFQSRQHEVDAEYVVKNPEAESGCTSLHYFDLANVRSGVGIPDRAISF